MLEFPHRSQIVEHRGQNFQQIISIPMEINFSPLLVDHFLYCNIVYYAECIQELIKDKQKIQKQKPLISVTGIFMMFCQLIIRTSALTWCIRYIYY